MSSPLLVCYNFHCGRRFRALLYFAVIVAWPTNYSVINLGINGSQNTKSRSSLAFSDAFLLILLLPFLRLRLLLSFSRTPLRLLPLSLVATKSR